MLRFDGVREAMLEVKAGPTTTAGGRCRNRSLARRHFRSPQAHLLSQLSLSLLRRPPGLATASTVKSLQELGAELRIAPSAGGGPSGGFPRVPVESSTNNRGGFRRFPSRVKLGVGQEPS